MHSELLRALGYLRAYSRWAALAVFSLLVSVAATVAIPQVTGNIIDDSVSARDIQSALRGGLVLLGLAAARSLFRYVQNNAAQRAAEGLSFDLRNAFFEKLLRLGFSYHDRAESGQLITRGTTDISSIRDFTAISLPALLQTVLVIVTTAVILFVMNWQLAIFALAVFPLITLLLLRFQALVPTLFRKVQERMGMLVSIVQENITNARIIRVFGREPYEAERFGSVSRMLYADLMKTVRAATWFFPIIQLFALAATALVIGVGGYAVIGGTLSLGDLVAFSTYVGILVSPVFGLGGIMFQLAGATASAKQLYTVFDAPLDVTDRPSAQPLLQTRGEIEFKGVTFRYPGSERDALTDINLTIKAGWLVAIVGPTGSGKSSLCYVLPRLYDVSSGAITVDGHDIRDVTLESLRKQVVIALQTTRLFSGSIQQNIAFGCPDASLDEIKEAARIAQADKFIEALPAGYDTELGESGSGLSGGQQQRIALARAVLLRPSVLVLDDSTSALDAETEYAFIQALCALPFQCTRLVVTGRPSSLLQRADVVLVVDSGRVVAQGRYEDLLSSERGYVALFSSDGSGTKQARQEVATT